MGADDVMLPNYLDVVGSAFEEYPKADVVQPGVQVIDEQGIACTPLVDAVKKVYAPKTSERIELKGEVMATSLVRADWAYFPSLAWRSETVKRIGFTEGLDVVQDLALLLDIAAEHGSMIVDPVLAFLYRRHSASDSSVRALDGRRFDEERRFFQLQAERFTSLGWKGAARAASFHTTSRLERRRADPEVSSERQVRFATQAGETCRRLATRKKRKSRPLAGAAFFVPRELNI